MDPRFSPFTLAPHDKDTAKALVINCKGDRAHTFKLNDLKLDCAGTNFDLDDHATHSTLCFLAPNLLWDDLLAVTGTDVATKEPPNEPYKILHNRETDNSISFQDKAGKIWNSSLSTDTCNTSIPWNTATKGFKQSTSQAKHRDQVSKHQATPNQNRFTILADTDTLDISNVQMHGQNQDGTSVNARAERALAKGDGSQVIFKGSVHLTQPASTSSKASQAACKSSISCVSPS